MMKATQPIVNQVYDSDDSTVSVYNNVNSDFKGRFRVLWEKLIHVKTLSTPAYASGVLSTAATNTTPGPQFYFEVKKKLNFLSDYSRGNAGTYADFDSGALVLGVLTSTGSTLPYQLKYRYNLEYSTHSEKHEII